MWRRPCTDCAYNAAVYREGLAQLKASLRDRELYLELFPGAKDADAVSLSIADLYERTGQYNKAIGFLEQRIRDNQKDASKVLSTEARIQVIYEVKLKDSRGLARTNKRVLDYYDKLPTRLKKELTPAALEAVARASLQKNEEQFTSPGWLTGARAPDPTREFEGELGAKTRALEEINRLYTPPSPSRRRPGHLVRAGENRPRLREHGGQHPECAGA